MSEHIKKDYEEITIDDIIETASNYKSIKNFKKDHIRMYIKACKEQIIKDLFTPYKDKLTGKVGIYFLFFKGEVVYIGKSHSCMKNRIWNHRKNGKIKVDKVEAHLVANRSNISILENYYICLYKPKFNVEYIYSDDMTIEIPDIHKYFGKCITLDFNK